MYNILKFRKNSYKEDQEKYINKSKILEQTEIIYL